MFIHRENALKAHQHISYCSILVTLKTRCTRGDARSFFCTYKTYLYAQN